MTCSVMLTTPHSRPLKAVQAKLIAFTKRFPTLVFWPVISAHLTLAIKDVSGTIAISVDGDVFGDLHVFAI